MQCAKLPCIMFSAHNSVMAPGWDDVRAFLSRSLAEESRNVRKAREVEHPSTLNMGLQCVSPKAYPNPNEEAQVGATTQHPMTERIVMSS